MKTAGREKVESVEKELSDLSMGQKLRKFRESTGLNCAEFAEKLGVSADVITSLESDEVELTVKMLIKIAETFGTLGIGRFLASPITIENLATSLRDKDTDAADNEHKRINRLPKQKKIDYFLEQVKGCLDFHCPPYQREVLLFITKGRKHAENPSGDIDYLIGKIEKMFAGCEVSFRDEVLSAYLDNVLPSLQAEYDKEVAEQDATDDLLSLTNGKTVGQIRTMIQVLKMNSTARKKYKKCS